MSGPVIEKILTMPIARGWTYRGTVDYYNPDTGVLVDWKTTGDTKSFREKKELGFQAELYSLLLEYNGYTVNDVRYVAVSRPAIRMCGKDPTPQDYHDRCIDWLREKPDRVGVFGIPLTQRSQAAALSWLETLTEYMDSRPCIPNPAACYPFTGSVCPYTNRCVNLKYDWGEIDPPTTPAPPKVIRHSDAERYMQCPRKWLFDQHYGSDDEHSESLSIGNMFHAGIAEWLGNPKANMDHIVDVICSQYSTIPGNSNVVQDTQKVLAMLRVTIERVNNEGSYIGVRTN